MSSSTKALKTDVNGKPVPQTFDSAIGVDDYVPEDRADAPATDVTSSWSMIALLKGILKVFLDVWDSVAHRLKVDATLTGSNVTDAKTLGAGDVGGANMLYNGATWDRQRANTEGTLLVSAARTVSVSSSMQTNYNGRGVIVILSVSAVSGTGGLTVKVWGRDPASANSYLIMQASVPVAAVGRYAYEIYPGASAAGVAAPGVALRTAAVLPRMWYADVVHSDATSYTYSLAQSTAV